MNTKPKKEVKRHCFSTYADDALAKAVKDGAWKRRMSVARFYEDLARKELGLERKMSND